MASKEIYYQYSLGDDEGSVLVVWLGWKKKLEVGQKLTLEQTGPVVWVVRSVFGPGLDLPPSQRWKVGGLD